MTREEAKGKVLAEDPVKVYRDLLTGQDTWYFSTYLNLPEASKSYDDFKKFIAEKLEVHYNDISIVGSAKTGFSLSPSKDLRAFVDEGDKPSDIDLVIVSSTYYEKFWMAYLDSVYHQKIFTFRDFATGIFKGFISVNEDHIFHPDLKNWNIKVDEFKKDIQLRFDIKHKINYRIFRSWTYVEKYYTYAIHQLRNNFERDLLKKN